MHGEKNLKVSASPGIRTLRLVDRYCQPHFQLQHTAVLKPLSLAASDVGTACVPKSKLGLGQGLHSWEAVCAKRQVAPALGRSRAVLQPAETMWMPL